MEARAFYRNYLKDVKLMQLATADNNKPWLCSVWYVVDDEDNIYWMSRKTRRHSIEIEANSHVAATFHKWFDKGLLEDPGQAVIISGQAEILSGEACRLPYDLYQKRYPRLNDFQSLDKFLNDEGHHYFYKLTPDEIIWWDEINFPNDPKQVVK